jgi:hypothetical protein
MGPRQFLSRFKSEILQSGERATAIIDADGHYELRYVPFEYVNTGCRIAFVGITPGNTQISLAYRALRRALIAGMDETAALLHAKSAAGFGGTGMRNRMNAMIRRFRIHKLVGISSPEEIWDEGRRLVHLTSVVPHAAFKKQKMFNGGFGEALKTALLRSSFENDFLPTLTQLPSDTKFVAIGPTALEALDWCVERGHLRPRQLLGAFAHPSGSAGSQVPYLIGEKKLEEFTIGDPVLRRVPWLDRARERLDQTVSDLLLTPSAAGD